jgi:cephalosporin hydroxylase
MIINSREGRMRQGLLDMIEYINGIIPTKDLTILEVGSFTGSGACMFAEHFKKVICVDAWEDDGLKRASELNWDKYNYSKSLLENEFDLNTSRYNNIEKIKGYSADVANKFDDKVDVVYIDADHDYESVKADLKAWKDKAKLFLCGHDYWEGRFDGVIKAVDELQKPDRVFCDGSWIIQWKN